MPINRALAAGGARDVERRLRAGGRRAAACGAAHRRVLGRRRRRAHAGLAKLPVPIGWVFEPDDPWEQFARGGEFTPFTPIVNVTGQPAAAVPFDVVDGLPAGIQLIGPPAGEALLFRLAAQLEAAHPWAQRFPIRFQLDRSRRELLASAAGARASADDRGTCRRRRAFRRRTDARARSSARAIAGAEPISDWTTTTFCAATALRPNWRSSAVSVSRGSARRSRFG